MTTTALLLVLLAAFAHSSWNFLAKRASESKHLIWFSSVIEALLFAPVAVWAAAGFRPSPGAAACLIATGVLHLLYTEALLRGYRSGDFSVVYPVARGTGPLLAFFGAVLLLGERISAPATAGALLVTFGTLVSSDALSGFRLEQGRAALIWGIATGCAIACYTVVDGYAVKALLVSPFLVEYSGNLFRAVLLSIGSGRGRASRSAEFRRCWKHALGIALLTPAGYILVLFAMRTAPVSRVAPVREMSMIIGAWLGVRFLHERNAVRRMIGSALIAAGVVALAA